MSNPVSPLQGKHAAGAVTVTDAGLRGMITLRGDLADKALQKACKQATGADLPGAGQVRMAGANALAWMSPDEVLLIVAHDAVAGTLKALDNDLTGKHFLAVNVSDARALITVAGPFAREVIAKLTPADVSPAGLQPGQMRRTRLGQVAAAYWMTDQATFHVICFRSVATYAFDLLAASAKAGPVGYFAPATG